MVETQSLHKSIRLFNFNAILILYYPSNAQRESNFTALPPPIGNVRNVYGSEYVGLPFDSLIFVFRRRLNPICGGISLFSI